jgi:hypothetical protein
VTRVDEQRPDHEYSFCRAAVRKEHPVGEDTSKSAERYQIVDAMENACKAGYKCEVLDKHGHSLLYLCAE